MLTPPPDADPAPPERGDVAVFAALLILLSVVVWFRYAPHSYLHGDGAMYFTMCRALLEKGTLRMEEVHPRSWYEQDLGWNREMTLDWSNIAVGSDGSWRPKHPILLPLLALPFFAAMGAVGLLVFNLLSATLGLFGGYRLARRILPRAPPAAFVAGLALVLPWPLFLDQVYSVSNDLLYAAFIVWGCECALARRPRAAGFLLGLAVFAKVTNLLIVAPLGVWLLLRPELSEEPKARLKMIAAGAVPVLALLVLNWAWFGSPLTTPYNRILARTGGEAVVADNAARFAWPSVAGIVRLWTFPVRGIEAYAPLLPLVAAGALVPARSLGPCLGARAAFLVASVLHLLFLSGYEYVHARFFSVVALLGVVWAGLVAWWVGSLISGLLKLSARAGGLAARAARGRAAWLASAPVALALVCLLALLAAALVRHAPGRAWRLSEAVEGAKVYLGTLPCDYFNAYHHKWECARKEQGGWSMWGEAIGEQCRVDGEPGPGFWAHPNPGRAARRLEVDLPESEGHLLLSAAMDDSARKAGVKVRFLLDGEPVWEPTVARGGETLEQLVELAGRKLLTVEVPVQAYRDRALCVDAAYAPPSQASTPTSSTK